jgi:hypothetical protein
MRREIEGAEAALQDAFAFVERSGERFWVADLYRVDGQIALRRPETPKPVSSRPSKSPTGKKPACSNCAPPPTLPGYGARQVRPTILALVKRVLQSPSPS